MAATTYSPGRGDSYFAAIHWKRALQLGLGVGAVMVLLTRGIPWVGSGAINPAIMGREIAPGQSATPLFSFTILTLHLIVSMLYGLIIVPIVHGFRPFAAGAMGGLVGLVLYFINYAIFQMMIDGDAQREWTSIATHIIFAVVVAEGYKGFARRRPENVPLM